MMWLSGFMNFIWPKPRPKASAELSPIHRKMFDAHMERAALHYENEENVGHRRCRVGKITKKHEPGAVVFIGE